MSIPNLGQQSFAGAVTKNTETHIGLCVLESNLIVEVTLAGYDASPNNITNLLNVTRAELAEAKATLIPRQ